MRLSDAIGVIRRLVAERARREGPTDNSGTRGGDSKVAELDGHSDTNIYTLSKHCQFWWAV
jgi:hypothetical protein